jgi:hypothetical protein
MGKSTGGPALDAEEVHFEGRYDLAEDRSGGFLRGQREAHVGVHGEDIGPGVGGPRSSRKAREDVAEYVEGSGFRRGGGPRHPVRVRGDRRDMREEGVEGFDTVRSDARMDPAPRKNLSNPRIEGDGRVGLPEACKGFAREFRGGCILSVRPS